MIGGGGRLRTMREELFFGGGRRFQVIDVGPFDEEDESLFVGMLRMETV